MNNLISKNTVASWTPENKPNPTFDLIDALYLEYVNDYLTVAAWGEAHHMDERIAHQFIKYARMMHDCRIHICKVLENNTNPHM